MALNRRQCTREFTFQVVREVEAGKPLAQVTREYQGHPTVIRRWPPAHQRDAARACAGQGRSDQDEARIAELERMLGQLTMENALRKQALLRLEARPRERNGNGGSSWSSEAPRRRHPVPGGLAPPCAQPWPCPARTIRAGSGALMPRIRRWSGGINSHSWPWRCRAMAIAA